MNVRVLNGEALYRHIHLWILVQCAGFGAAEQLKHLSLCFIDLTKTHPCVLLKFSLRLVAHSMPVEENVHECFCSRGSQSSVALIFLFASYRFAHFLPARRPFLLVRTVVTKASAKDLFFLFI